MQYTSVTVGDSSPSNGICGWKFLGFLYFLLMLGIVGLLAGSRNDGSLIDDAAPTTLAALMPRAIQSPSLRTVVVPGRAAFNKLGMPSSPMMELALNSLEQIDNYNAGRDVSVRASMRSAMANLDAKGKSLVVRASEKAKLNVEDMAGVLPPTGLFDPLGFSTNCDAGKLLFYREVELKHGRVGMLASLGILVGENFHPLFGGNIDVPAYVAFQQTPLNFFWPAVVLAIAIPEVSTFDKYDTSDTGNLWVLKDDAVPGDIGYDPLGLKPTDPKEFKEMQNKELNNGRLAMLAAAGMIAQELVSGEKILR